MQILGDVLANDLGVIHPLSDNLPLAATI